VQGNANLNSVPEDLLDHFHTLRKKAAKEVRLDCHRMDRLIVESLAREIFGPQIAITEEACSSTFCVGLLIIVGIIVIVASAVTAGLVNPAFVVGVTVGVGMVATGVYKHNYKTLGIKFEEGKDGKGHALMSDDDLNYRVEKLTKADAQPAQAVNNVVGVAPPAVVEGEPGENIQLEPNVVMGEDANLLVVRTEPQF